MTNMAFGMQLSVSKSGIIKVGAEPKSGYDLETLDFVKTETVKTLQWNYTRHTIWLVGEYIYVIHGELDGVRQFHWASAEIEVYLRMRIGNLLKVADFLDTLPAERFDTRTYCMDEHGEHLPLQAHECGVVRCPIGWGPVVGLPPLHSEVEWQTYGERVFGLEPHRAAWNWCFPTWTDENNPAAAAKRIRNLVYEGVPRE